jgi:hypothetical protein
MPGGMDFFFFVNNISMSEYHKKCLQRARYDPWSRILDHVLRVRATLREKSVWCVSLQLSQQGQTGGVYWLSSTMFAEACETR